LVKGVEPIAFNKADRQAKRHGSIIGPLSCLEMEGASADHIRQRFEAPPWAKLDGSTDSVSNRKTQKATTEPILFVHLYPQKQVNGRVQPHAVRLSAGVSN
jgi:hypothetical protein